MANYITESLYYIILIVPRLNAKELRKSKPTNEDLAIVKRNPIYFVLDNIIDTYNIGSLFRLADSVAATKMYLCGEMEYPPSSRIHKAAVGTEAWVPWEKAESTIEAIRGLKDQRVQIITVEPDKKSIVYRQLTTDKIKFPVAIVVGNETGGIGKEV